MARERATMRSDVESSACESINGLDSLVLRTDCDARRNPISQTDDNYDFVLVLAHFAAVVMQLLF